MYVRLNNIDATTKPCVPHLERSTSFKAELFVATRSIRTTLTMFRNPWWWDCPTWSHNFVIALEHGSHERSNVRGTTMRLIGSKCGAWMTSQHRMTTIDVTASRNIQPESSRTNSAPSPTACSCPCPSPSYGVHAPKSHTSSQGPQDLSSWRCRLSRLNLTALSTHVPLHVAPLQGLGGCAQDSTRMINRQR